MLLIHDLDIASNIHSSAGTSVEFVQAYLLSVYAERVTALLGLLASILAFIDHRNQEKCRLRSKQVTSQFTPSGHRSSAQAAARLSFLQRLSINRSTATRRHHLVLLLLRPPIRVRALSPSARRSDDSLISSSHVTLMEQLTFDLVSRCLPLVSDHKTLAYQSVSIESMCSFCVELLSLSTLPATDHHAHYHLAKSLLDSIHQTTRDRPSFILKSYLSTIKHLQFQSMTQEELQVLLDLLLPLRQVSFPCVERRAHSLLF